MSRREACELYESALKEAAAIAGKSVSKGFEAESAANGRRVRRILGEDRTRDRVGERKRFRCDRVRARVVAALACEELLDYEREGDRSDFSFIGERSDHASGKDV
jgi:hypothetical protein